MKKTYFRCVSRTTPIVCAKHAKKLRGRRLAHWVQVGVATEGNVRKPIYRAVLNMHGKDGRKAWRDALNAR